MPWLTPGPTVIDWDLLRRAATELAEQLTIERSTAAVAAGASELSRRVRTELRAGLEGIELEGADADDLVERLLQVRVEDFDGRSGWRRFDDARRGLRRARTLGARREAAAEAVAAGLDLFGAPVRVDEPLEQIEVAPEDIQLIGYEALVTREPTATPPPGTRLFEQGGDQLELT